MGFPVPKKSVLNLIDFFSGISIEAVCAEESGQHCDDTEDSFFRNYSGNE
jgi:hypothetical protein